MKLIYHIWSFLDQPLLLNAKVSAPHFEYCGVNDPHYYVEAYCAQNTLQKMKDELDSQLQYPVVLNPTYSRVHIPAPISSTEMSSSYQALEKCHCTFCDSLLKTENF